jgi:hyperosmotically inducible protein
VSYNANMTRDEYEKNKESYSADAKRMGSTIGSGANDAWLWTKVRAALTTADDLRDSTINVDVDNSVVTLRGTVADGKQKIRAVDVAKKVDGVKSVTNKLTLKGEGDAGSTNANANKKG